MRQGQGANGSHEDEHEAVHPFDEWRGASGIFIIVNLRGAVAEQVHALQERYDPRLAKFAAPHITLIGSSGAGPIAADTSLVRLRETLEPITHATPPIALEFGAPVRFMQTNTIALPLDPHGPLRELHERIRRSGLSFAQARHAFTPHVTLSLYRTPTEREVRELLGVRITEPVEVDHVVCSLTEEPYPPRPLLELTLGNGRAPDAPP
jgi:2'-5' RNA ligase